MLTEYNGEQLKVLKDEYNDYASKLILTQKKLNNLNEQYEKLTTNSNATWKRLQLYVRNSIWNNFMTNKYSFVVQHHDKDNNKNTLYFFKQSDFKVAQQAYFEQELDDIDATEKLNELETFINEGFFEDELEDNTKNKYDKHVDFILKYLKKPYHVANITKQQNDNMEILISQQLTVDNKKAFLDDQQDMLNDEYASLLSTIVEHMSEDEEYADFNFEENEIMAVKDKETNAWHLAYTL